MRSVTGVQIADFRLELRYIGLMIFTSYPLLASERSERDTIRGVQIRAGAVRIYISVYIYLLRTPPRCSVEINVFVLG